MGGRGMRSAIILWIFYFLMLAGPLTALCTRAEGAEFFELRKAAIEGGQYYGVNRDYFLQLDNEKGERLQHTTDLLMDIDVMCVEQEAACIFWNNKIASKASNQQYRSVAWDFKVGISFRSLDIGWHHTSLHELDRKTNPYARFGLENVFYIQFKWFENPRYIWR
jgi:hypothetical protein